MLKIDTGICEENKQKLKKYAKQCKKNMSEEDKQT